MRNSSYILIASVLGSSVPGQAAEFPGWPEYLKANQFACPGPFDSLKKPRTVFVGGKQYLQTGYRLSLQNPGDPAPIAIGVMSAIKDTTSGTKRNMAATLEWFKQNKVEWIVANGDLAEEELDLEEILDLLGQSGLPVLLVLGNSESKGSFARVYKDRTDKFPNLVNGVLVRQVVLGAVELWTVPGYYDKHFAHQGASCAYGDKDLEAMSAALEPVGKAPVLLVSHGPPRGKGKKALDWISAGENRGDQGLTDLIAKKKIAFGIFGHILEAGGAAVGKDLSTPIKPDTDSTALYVNAGSLSADPWGMNDGSASYGMAMIVTVNTDKARYMVKRFASAEE